VEAMRQKNVNGNQSGDMDYKFATTNKVLTYARWRQDSSEECEGRKQAP